MVEIYTELKLSNGYYLVIQEDGNEKSLGVIVDLYKEGEEENKGTATLWY